MFEGLQLTAKRAFRFTRIVCFQMLQAFFVVFPGKFEQVQGEGLPIDGVTHQYGCNSLEQSSGAAEECGDIEAPLSFNCLKVYSSPLNKHFVLLA